MCQGESILWKHKQVLWKMELRDVRKLGREKMSGEHKIPWLLCKRMSSTDSTDQKENLSVVGKGRNQEVRVCSPGTVGISLDDSAERIYNALKDQLVLGSSLANNTAKHTWMRPTVLSIHSFINISHSPYCPLIVRIPSGSSLHESL
jgi:hypothetical protein